ncbi:MAG: TonB family protein [Bdellovibrionaceae bacterium]|nr:TonB family protein [Pseudobdellovibrionaceae bacterium]
MHRFSLFLLISVFIHIAFYFSVYYTPAAPKKSETIDVSYIEATPKVVEPKDKLEKNRQIVDQEDQALNNEIPEDEFYLSKNNQKVLKPTVAREKGEFKNTKQNKSPQKASPSQTSAPAIAKKNEKFNPLSDMTASFKQKSFDTMASNHPSSSAAVSQTQDYLKNTALGVETILSTKEFKYYTYFNRIRKQLSEHWEPKVRDKLTKMFRQGRTIASNQDRTTKLLIILDQKGVLVNVQLVSDSGVKDLDEAAMESFRSAAPFPNPPKGIVDPDGTVKIRWDFILES